MISLLENTLEMIYTCCQCSCPKLEIIDDLVFQPDSDPFNLRFPEWTALWWKWILSIPRESSPALDLTGEFCSKFQYNENVWLLAGTFGGSAIRNCTIPHGKAILFPVITSEFSYSQDPYLKSEEQLTRAVTKDIDTVDLLTVVIDKVTFVGINKLRIRSEPFNYDIDGVDTTIVSDGYWIFLKPQKIGNHIIYFAGRNFDFFNEVTYHVSII
jgi:hypothetical protein